MNSFKPGFLSNFKSIIIHGLGIVLLISYLSSCRSPLNFVPVRYGRTEINTLMADSAFGYLLLQFKSQNGGDSRIPFGLISYSFDTSNKPISTIPYPLLVDSGAKSKNFKDTIIMGNQMASRKDLSDAITDPNSKLVVDYDFLLFTPALDPDNHYVYYIIKARKLGGDTSAVVPAGSRTQPCPPAICRAANQQ
ncbi:MAG: hypothetical protein M3Z56_00965 [Bacteroidota bacterium]|nr:hypothetical protein [Bacteroidota bacterium]